MMKKAAFLTVFCIMLSGCAMPGNYTHNYSPTPGIVMHTYSDDLQNAFFKEGPVPTKYCLEPSPDLGESISEALNLTEGTEKLGVKDGSKAVPLGGRANLTLVTRTLLYRACELSLNLNADADETMKIYDKFLTTLEKIAPHTSTQIINNVSQ